VCGAALTRLRLNKEVLRRIIQAQTLRSPAIAKELVEFQNRVFIEQYTPMNELWRTCKTDCQWETFHLKNEAMLNESNQSIVKLATDLGLTKK
jgi:hypothetical protein